MNMSAWVLAIRPKTLPAAVAPVLIGTAMAYGDGMVHWRSAFACAFAALMIQIATNLVNDYCEINKDKLKQIKQKQWSLPIKLFVVL